MNTETPPTPLSSAEAVQILTDGRLLASLTPRQKDAVLRAVHLVSRRSAQKERNERNRRARGVHFTPPEVLANPPFAPLLSESRAALAAPARNCDRFATEDEAREAYWAYRDPLEFNDKPFVAITEWLFAPAEGGKK
jgi:hypothetical protein